ncbi:Rrf2 family transcriptional regulator [Geovibrio thiophilus]|uniref:Rrf2 family transcriptional regulator n=1 Tax=Geovibrio thiophilus TaxID=139438 RepID=A0A3R5V2I7_9BACT|nr:Rrf2 family transcriptional regulator [Geovibrio thiophilus]QAR33996.1 Rrf2 family transcriptional regulator [Geovibrio thiophilus]
MTSKNIQFSIAVHIMTGLGFHAGEFVCSCDLARSVNACPSFVRRIISKLSKAGLVRTTRGKNGSCALAKEPESVTLLDIYKAVEAPKAFAVHAYPVQEACAVSCNMKPALEKILDNAQKSFEDNLKQTRLSELVSQVS